MMKCGRKIFFAGGRYNSPGTDMGTKKNEEDYKNQGLGDYKNQGRGAIKTNAGGL